MPAMVTAISAFSARGARGRRGVLLVFSALLALVILGVSHQVAARAAEEAAAAARTEEVIVTPSYEVAPAPPPKPPLGALEIADLIAMLILGGGLFVVAPAMAAAQVGEERRSGTLDLLRTAPLSPNQLVAGFLLGAPTSLYLLLAGPLAVHLAAGIAGVLPHGFLLGSLVLLVSGTAFMMLLSVLAALSIGREAPGGAASLGIAGVLGVFALVTMGLASDPFSATWAHLHPAGAMSVLYHSTDGPYRDALGSSWYYDQSGYARYFALTSLEPILATLVYLAASGLLLLAARRALAGETPSRLSKAEAVGLFLVAALAIMVPMRIVMAPGDVEIGNLAALATALVLPYVACVLGATPSSSAYGAGRVRGLAGKASPWWAAVVMLGSAAASLLLLYGRCIAEIVDHGHHAVIALALAGLALTLPIYALFAATRLQTAGGRLAFWALVIVHMALQIPSIGVFFGPRTWHDPVPALLARLGITVGLIFPLVIAWRQRVGDRRLEARAV